MHDLSGMDSAASQVKSDVTLLEPTNSSSQEGNTVSWHENILSRENTLTGGSQPGQLEALKQMLYKLQEYSSVAHKKDKIANKVGSLKVIEFHYLKYWML